MTGAETIELVKVIGSIITTVGVPYLLYLQNKTKVHVEAVDTKVDTNTAITNEAVAQIGVLKNQTDGMKSELVAAVTDAANLKGRADLAAEQKHDQSIIDSVKSEVAKVNGTPAKVEIVQDPNNPVPVETVQRIGAEEKER